MSTLWYKAVWMLQRVTDAAAEQDNVHVNSQQKV